MPTADDLKTWFAQYGALSADIDNAIRRIEALRSSASSPQIAHITGMPRGGGLAADDRIGERLGQIDALEAETRRKIAEGVALRREYEAAICKICRRGWPDRRAVLRMRYIDLCGWPEICEMLFGDRDDYDSRYDTFLRRCHRVHKDALEELAEILTMEGVTTDGG